MPSKSQQGAGDAAPADPFADQQRQGHHPQHGGVGEHARAARRHALHAEIGEGEEQGELEGADRQHDRPVGAARPSQAPERGQHREGGQRRQRGARRGQPDRRAGRKTDLDGGPGEAEQHDRRRELQPRDARHARGVRDGHGLYARLASAVVSGCGRRDSISLGTTCQKRSTSRFQSFSRRAPGGDLVSATCSATSALSTASQCG